MKLKIRWVFNYTMLFIGLMFGFWLADPANFNFRTALGQYFILGIAILIVYNVIFHLHDQLS